MGWGDEIVAAGQAQSAWENDKSKRVAILDVRGWPRWHDLWTGNPIIAHPDDVLKGEDVHRVTNGPHCRPYIVYPFSTQTGWTFNRDFHCRDHVAKLYLTEDELARGRQARERYGKYILIEPYTKHVNFQWPIERWAALVAACPDLTFVQHIHKDTVALVPGAKQEPATWREACGLIQSAAVYVRSESGLCHAAAALGTKQVTLFGGCMDPDVMGGYKGQTVLADTEQGSPCGSWQPCAHCQGAMLRIAVDRVVEVLRGHLKARRAAA